MTLPVIVCPLVSQQQSIEPCLQIVLPSWFLKGSEGGTGRQGGRKAGREGNSWRESVTERERLKLRELVTREEGEE